MGKKKHVAAFKTKVSFEAVKGEKMLTQLASEYGVHLNQMGQWKKRLLNEPPTLFSDKGSRLEKKRNELEDELYRQIGQLKVELEWLKKSKLLS